MSFTILCQYSPHTPDRTHPQGAGGGGGRENGTTYTDLYTCCICNHVYVYIYNYIYIYTSHLPTGGEITGTYTYMSSYISIDSWTPQPQGIIPSPGPAEPYPKLGGGGGRQGGLHHTYISIYIYIHICIYIYTLLYLGFNMNSPAMYCHL